MIGISPPTFLIKGSFEPYPLIVNASMLKNLILPSVILYRTDLMLVAQITDEDVTGVPITNEYGLFALNNIFSKASIAMSKLKG